MKGGQPVYEQDTIKRLNLLNAKEKSFAAKLCDNVVALFAPAPVAVAA